MNIRLRTFLASFFSALAALAVLAALAMVSLARDGEEHASYLVDSVRSVESAERIALDLHELSHATGTPADAAAISLLHDVAVNRALIQSQAEEKIIVRLEADVAALLAARADEDKDEAGRRTFERALQQAGVGQSELLQINLDQARGAEALTMEHGRRAVRIAALVAAALIAAMLALIILVRGQVIRPLAALREAIQRLALGESGVRAPEKRAVELRELASTFNSMAALIDEQRRGRAEILGRVASAMEGPLLALQAQLERLSPAAPLPSEEELRKLHAQVVLQSLQIERRIAEFLDAARAEAGELTLSRAPCDLRELVRDSIDLFRSVSAAHTFELDAPAPVPAVADADRLAQVLHALFALALRRAPGGGVVAVKLHQRDRMALLSIEAGEPEGSNSFEALFNELRGLGTLLRDIPGVLFGLDVSRKLIEAHGGQIEVNAQGNRFQLAIPLAPPADLPAGARKNPAPGSELTLAARSDLTH